MRIVTFLRINEFTRIHSTSDVALRDWYKKTKEADWQSFNDIKQTFNRVDYVGNSRFVFDVKGDDYRLVAIIFFASKKVYIRFIGTHEDYNKIDCLTI